MSFDRLHQAINHDITTIAATDWPELGRRLHAALGIELAHPSTPDGMPTQTIGAAPSSTPAATLDVDVALTSVEAAVEARRRHRDDVRRTVTMAIAHINEAGRHVQSVFALLDQLDKLRENKTGESTEDGCAIMEEAGCWEQVAHRMLINGKSTPVSEWVYRFANKQGRLPTLAERQARATGRRVMIKATA